jgi:hypothetical protein
VLLCHRVTATLSAETGFSEDDRSGCNGGRRVEGRRLSKSGGRRCCWKVGNRKVRLVVREVLVQAVGILSRLN